MNDNKRLEVELLFWELNRIYSSEHSDASNEIAQAIEALYTAIFVHHYDKEKIRLRLQQMVDKLDREGSKKPKLSVAINSRFWEKNYQTMIPRRFKVQE
jgi:hypothetical protein